MKKIDFSLPVSSNGYDTNVPQKQLNLHKMNDANDDGCSKPYIYRRGEGVKDEI